MNKRSWSDEDRDEFDDLVTDALSEKAVPRRRDIFLAGLDDAVQAKRYWASDVLHEIRDRGADRILGREHEGRKPRIPVASEEGLILGTVPRIMGVRRRTVAGQVEHQRMLFDYMTFDELRAKLPWLAQQIAAYERDAHAVLRLLVLESKAPGSRTPAEACTQLGISVEDYLAQAV